MIRGGNVLYINQYTSCRSLTQFPTFLANALYSLPSPVVQCCASPTKQILFLSFIHPFKASRVEARFDRVLSNETTNHQISHFHQCTVATGLTGLCFAVSITLLEGKQGQARASKGVGALTSLSHLLWGDVMATRKKYKRGSAPTATFGDLVVA